MEIADHDPPRPALVAPIWHTALLVALFLGFALGGALFQRPAMAHPAAMRGHPRVAPLYLSRMAAEWGVVLFVWRGGLRRRGVSLRELVGGRWTSPRDRVVDVALATAL